MEKSTFTPKFYLIVGLILFGAFLRLMPHWPNFTPIAAMALVGGSFIKRKDLAMIIPVLSMLISDAIIGFHGVMFPVYISFILIVGLGYLLRSGITPLSVAGASLLSSLLFFLITNFAAWSSGLMPYSVDFPGLIQAYIAGLPFFLNGILGDLFYNGIFFGLFYFVTQRFPAFAK
ncbi:MAG: hypothetical protein IPH88_01130 [Bacteroidales bacterium]|nr:hypothetical protein [Bacteroidales bacterium]